MRNGLISRDFGMTPLLDLMSNSQLTHLLFLCFRNSPMGIINDEVCEEGSDTSSMSYL